MWKDARDVNVSLKELKTALNILHSSLESGDFSHEDDYSTQFEELNEIINDIKIIIRTKNNTQEYANYIADVFMKVSDDVLRETSQKFKKIESSDELINKYKEKLLTGAKEINDILKNLNEVYGDYNYFKNLASNLNQIFNRISKQEESFKKFYNSILFSSDNETNDKILMLNNDIRNLKDYATKALSYRKQLKLLFMNLKIVDSDSDKKDVLVENIENSIKDMNKENDKIHEYLKNYKGIDTFEGMEGKQDTLLSVKGDFEILGKEIRSIDTLISDFRERMKIVSNISLNQRLSFADLSAEYEEAMSELNTVKKDFASISNKRVRMILEKLNNIIDDTQRMSGTKSPVNPVYLVGDFKYNDLLKDFFKKVEELEDLIIQDKHSLIRNSFKSVTDVFHSIIAYENKVFSASHRAETDILINSNKELTDILDNLYHEEDYKNIDLINHLMDFKRKFKRHLINEDVNMWKKL